ncbi:MAG: hypothetical protein ACE5E6_06580 [Phycisphaerae bacterium]
MITKLFPELQRFPTKKAQREAWSIAKQTVGTSWRYWTAVAGIVAPSVVIQFSLRRLGIPLAWRGTVRWLVVAATVTACLAVLWAFGKTIRRILWRLLMDHGIPCCGSCGYDLRLLPTDRVDGVTVCPECGCGWKLDKDLPVDGHGDG